MTAADGFEAFFRAEHPRVVALGMAITGSSELAKDLAQEAFLRAYRDWERLSSYDRPEQWVRRVAVNLAMDDHRRRRTARRAVERIPPSPPLVPDLVADEWWHVVRELPERQRAAVALHYLDDLPVVEVARLLGVTDGTVKASLAHARATLAKRLGPTQPESEIEEERRP